MQKKAYAAPKLQAHGKLEDLTRGKSSGTHVDAGFVVAPGSPLPTFTFT